MRSFWKNFLIESLVSLGYAVLCAVGGISCLMMTAQPSPDGTSPYNAVQSDVLLAVPLVALAGLIGLIILDSKMEHKGNLKFYVIPMRIAFVVLLFLPVSLLWINFFGQL